MTIWKKDGIVWDGLYIDYNNRRIFNPKEEQLIAAGYEKVEIQPSKEEILRQYEDAVQEFLDQTAQSRHYDSTYTCLSYLDSTNETWNRESHAFNEWRDHVWETCHVLLAQYEAGEIEELTIDELLESLPIIDWHDPA